MCPIGFQRAQTAYQRILCYRKKPPEKFEDFYKGCSKNLFSTTLYKALDIDKSGAVWSEYKNEGETFINTISSDSIAAFTSEFRFSFNIDSLKQQLCILINQTEYVAENCNAKHFRYCFVEPILVNDDRIQKECSDFNDSMSFRSPVPVCLAVFRSETRNASVEAAEQAAAFCKNKGLSLLRDSWLYAKHPRLQANIFPTLCPGSDNIHWDELSATCKNLTHLIDYQVGADLTNRQFSQIICERTINKTKVELKIEIHNDTLSLTRVGKDANMSFIQCFGVTLSPGPYSIHSISMTDDIGKMPEKLLDGLYQCIYRCPITSEVVKSNYIRYWRDRTSLSTYYVVEATINGFSYIIDKSWDKINEKITQLIPKYIRVQWAVNVTEFQLKNFDWVRGIGLFHVKLNSPIGSLSPVFHDDYITLCIRPLYVYQETRTKDAEKVQSFIQGHSGINEFQPLIFKDDCNKPSKLDEVISELKRNIKGSVSVANARSVFHEVNDIQKEEQNSTKIGSLLHLVEQLGSSVRLDTSQNVATIVEPNIALIVGEAKFGTALWGFQMIARNSTQFTKDTFQLLTNEPSLSSQETDAVEVMVVFPATVVASATRVSFVAYRDDVAFRSSIGLQSSIVNSRVISVTIQNTTHFEEGQEITIYFRPIKSNILRNESQTCAYWQFTSEDDESGYWSQEGCTFTRASRPGSLDVCRCDHLTHFAEILVPRTVFSESDENALEIISIVGCCLSILGLTAVAVTAALFRSWRRDFSNKIWLQLCMSILFMSVCFLVIVFARFDRYNTACMLVGIALHYSVLCSFCWMLVAAVLSYRRLVLVYATDPTHKLLKASAFSYGTPFVVVCLLLSVDIKSYERHFEETIPAGSFCYPSGLGLWLSVYMPISAMLLANWTMFALIVRSVFWTTQIQRHGSSNEALRCACVSCFLVFLFGLPWVTGIFAHNLVAAYLYTITATFQGFTLFIFLVLAKKQVRNMWLDRIRRPSNASMECSTTFNTNSNVFILKRNNRI